MSFMMVCGKIYICAKCRRHVTISYRGGSMITQIGDINVARQLKLSRQIGQPHDDPDNQGYYLYDIDGICSTCYESGESEAARQNNDKIVECIELMETEREAAEAALASCLPGALDKVAAEITLSDLCEAIDANIDPWLGDKYALPGKRKRQLNKFVNDHKSHLEAYLIKKACAEEFIDAIVDLHNQKIEILSGLLKNMLRKTSAIKAAFKHAWQGGFSLLEKLFLLFGQGYLVYMMHRIDAAENLNDYIVAYTTVREPEEDTPNDVFYFPVVIMKIDILNYGKLSPSKICAVSPNQMKAIVRSTLFGDAGKKLN